MNFLATRGWDRNRRKRRPQSDAGHMLLFDQPSEIEEALPLYEGQLINRYDHKARTYCGYKGANKYGLKPGIPVTSDNEKADPNFEIEPRYWMRREAAVARVEAEFGGKAIVGFRDTSRPWNDRRTARSALVLRYPATAKVPVFGIAPSYTFDFLGFFNSSTFDFFVRGHLPGNTVRLKWMLSQIPAPLPGTLDPRVAEHAAKLSLTSNSVARLFQREPHIWNPEERYALDVEIDALVAHAYGLTRAQYEVVLDSFEVLARLEIVKHGRYRFKEDCLRAYGREW